MNFILDTHCHTVASGHAYSTIEENAAAAAAKGLKLIAITDHGPNMPGSCSPLHFRNLRILPRELHGVEILPGAELNILDDEGGVDLDEQVLKKLKVVIASLHTLCIPEGTAAYYTRAVIAAMQNRYVKIIGHLGDPHFPVDLEKIVSAAKNTGAILEVNNESFNPASFRAGSEENILRMLKLCAEKEVYVVAASDAHMSYQIGVLDHAEKIIEDSGIPERLVLNMDPERLKERLGL